MDRNYIKELLEILNEYEYWTTDMGSAPYLHKGVVWEQGVRMNKISVFRCLGKVLEI